MGGCKGEKERERERERETEKERRQRKDRMFVCVFLRGGAP